MKKLTIWALAVVMVLGMFTVPAQAAQPMAAAKQVTEGNRDRRPDRGRDRGRHDRDRYDRNRGKRKSSGSNFAGALIGSLIGSAISGAINDKPAPVYREPVLVYDYSCNCYYYR